jgi:hypothetical protein
MKIPTGLLLAICTQCSFAQWPTQIIVVPRQISPQPIAPIDYLKNSKDPFESARQGFELGRAMREEEERRNLAAQQRAEQEASRFQAMQMQRLMAEQMVQMQQQQKLLETQADELRRLREVSVPQK